MKYYFDGVIVVEGKHDCAHVSSFVDSLFVVTNGFDVPLKELDFLKNLPSNKKVIVLTDSDQAGEIIRFRINEYLPNSTNARVNILKCNKKGKSGVAECEQEEIINVLKEHFVEPKQSIKSLSTSDLNLIGLNNKDKREFVSKKLHLGICNSKTLLKRINYLGIQIDDLKKALEDYYGD